MYASQRLSFLMFRKTFRGKPGSERYSGNPTVADRRGACGNVDVIRRCAHRSSIPTRDDMGGLWKRGPWWNEAPTSPIERASAGHSLPQVARAAGLSRQLLI